MANLVIIAKRSDNILEVFKSFKSMSQLFAAFHEVIHGQNELHHHRNGMRTEMYDTHTHTHTLYGLTSSLEISFCSMASSGIKSWKHRLAA